MVYGSHRTCSCRQIDECTAVDHPSCFPEPIYEVAVNSPPPPPPLPPSGPAYTDYSPPSKPSSIPISFPEPEISYPVSNDYSPPAVDDYGSPVSPPIISGAGNDYGSPVSPPVNNYKPGNVLIGSLQPTISSGGNDLAPSTEHYVDDPAIILEILMKTLYYHDTGKLKFRDKKVDGRPEVIRFFTTK